MSLNFPTGPGSANPISNQLSDINKKTKSHTSKEAKEEVKTEKNEEKEIRLKKMQEIYVKFKSESQNAEERYNQLTSEEKKEQSIRNGITLKRMSGEIPLTEAELVWLNKHNTKWLKDDS